MQSSRIEQLLLLLKAEPEDSFLNYALALEYAKQDELSKAIAIIESVLKKTPDYLGAYYQLGQLYEQNNQISKAIACYKKGIEIAQFQQNKKTLSELNQALFLVEDK